MLIFAMHCMMIVHATTKHQITQLHLGGLVHPFHWLCDSTSHFATHTLVNLPASFVVAMTAEVNTPTPNTLTAATEMAYFVTGFKPPTVNLTG